MLTWIDLRNEVITRACEAGYLVTAIRTIRLHPASAVRTRQQP
jgi:hypothetical protein